jgi:hypothetical protein
MWRSTGSSAKRIAGLDACDNRPSRGMAAWNPGPG